ncbi:hypothetical protein H8S95_14125 [Pontibacter sp. KCTC 32443]|uniref:hypothetical protein n=1 Tax=Pontibacter deserti TaxID=1343896 RepID=UPI0019B93778|nr:hypothetical protein [Pontibacter deserti]MBC5775212.1 hypothetical protein [Pontibacter sp. KCTC 32443]
MTLENFENFLKEHTYKKVSYGSDCGILLKHSSWQNKVYVTIAGKTHKLYIWQRHTTKVYQEWLQEAFGEKFIVEGTYRD